LAVPGQAERIIKHLDRYIIREDVQLTDVTSDFAWHLVVDRDASDVGDEASIVAPCDILWPGERLVRTGKSDDLPLAGLPTTDTESPVWNALRSESLFPLYGVDFDDSHLPQEINRDARAISFTKGCYLGQETVARIDALGHVNKKLVLVKFNCEHAPATGTKLHVGEHEVGTITTSSWSPRLNAPIGFGFVQRGSNEIGTKLSSEFADAEVIKPATAST
jgi:folate-binding protein YgfZ